MFQATSFDEAYCPSSKLNPCAATRRIELSPPAPIQIGGCGFCAVGGSTTIFSNCQYLPRWENGSGGPRLEDDRECLVEARVDLFHRHAEAGELVVTVAFADTEIEAAPGILLHSPDLSRRARPLNRYLRHEAGLGGRVRELAILTTARELDSQFEWAAHESEAVAEGVSREIIDIIKHRKDTSGLDEVDAIVIELGRQIFGARKVTSATFARALRQFGRRTLVDLVALMGNYAGTAALLTAFDMQLDPSQPPPLPQP